MSSLQNTKVSNKNKTQAMALYAVAMFLLSWLNVVVKRLMTEFSMSSNQIMTIRMGIIVAFLLPVMLKDKTVTWSKAEIKENLTRNIMFYISTYALYESMRYISVNNVTILSFISPILASVLSCFMLKEKVHRGIWFSLLVCFFSVLIIKNPSTATKGAVVAVSNIQDINKSYIYVLITIIIRGWIPIKNKQITQKFSKNTILYYNAIIMFIISASLSVKGWKIVPFGALKLIFLASALYGVELYLVSVAVSKCNISTLQPLDFLRLLFSMLISYVVLSEKTTVAQVIGGMLILSGNFASFIVAKNDNKKLNK